MNESTYEIITNELGDELITRTDSDGKVWTIPADENNSDYQAYLASLDESVTLPEIIEPVEESEPTEPADEPSPDTE
jgi:hypothetical protein